MRMLAAVAGRQRSALVAVWLVVAAAMEDAEILLVLVDGALRREEVVLRLRIHAVRVEDDDPAREDGVRQVVVAGDRVRRDERGRAEADLDPVLRDEGDPVVAAHDVAPDD